MSLYIRLQSSFWSNRKTLRLRASIGDSAFWIPPRLWSYAADNQPNGDFSDYSDDEIGMLVGYKGNAQALLQALHQAGFLKERRINDWKEHNEYHSVFSDRARKAANARWGKDKKRQERKGKETSIASRMLVALPPSLKSLVDFEKEWEAFRDHRRKVRAPMTAHTEELILALLAERPTDAAKAIQAAMSQGWRGFKWEWYDNYKSNNGTHQKHSSESNRNLGTANEGKSAQYKGFGKV